MMEKLSAWEPRVRSLLRIVTGLLYLEHGTQKLFDFPASGHGVVNMQSIMGVAGVLEVVGGVLFVLGFLTRPVAFILSGMMAVAFWTVHFKGGIFPVNNGGDAAVLFCFIFFYFVFAGAGPISVDARRRT